MLEHIEARLFFEEHELVRIGGVRKSELARLVNFPHGLLHLLKAEKIIRHIEEVVVDYVLVVPHFE